MREAGGGGGVAEGDHGGGFVDEGVREEGVRYIALAKGHEHAHPPRGREGGEGRGKGAGRTNEIRLEDLRHGEILRSVDDGRA